MHLRLRSSYSRRRVFSSVKTIVLLTHSCALDRCPQLLLSYRWPYILRQNVLLNHILSPIYAETEIVHPEFVYPLILKPMPCFKMFNKKCHEKQLTGSW